MNALILAAGLGSRLSSYTRDIPKALVEVNSKPLLSHQIEALLEQSVDHIYIVTGYKHQLIRSFVGRYPADKITLIHNPRFSTSNSAFSWLLASPFLASKPYLHLNCDVIFDQSLLSRLLSEYYKSEFSTLVVRPDLKLGPDMEQVLIDDDSRILTCLARINYTLNAKAYGLAVFNPFDTSRHHVLLSSDIFSGDFNANFYSAIRRSTLTSSYFALSSTRDYVYEFNTISDLEGYSKM